MMMKRIRLAVVFTCIFAITAQSALGALAQSNVWMSRRLPPPPVRDHFPFPNVSTPVVPLTRARIEDVFQSSEKNPTKVFLIQDVHMNREAQLNMAAVLESLIEKKKVGFVGVEGAFGPLDYTPFRSFPDPSVAKEVADAFLKLDRSPFLSSHYQPSRTAGLLRRRR